VRLLIVPAGAKGSAVLYRPIAPDAPGGEAWSVSTPAGGTVSFDQVVRLDRAVVEIMKWEKEVRVRVSVPLADLGLREVAGKTLRMDWGVLGTRDGHATTARRYWANRLAVGTSDEPTEARLEPGLWGYVRFTPPQDSLEPQGAGPSPGSGNATDELLDDLLK
jgi:hypothetical protein